MFDIKTLIIKKSFGTNILFKHVNKVDGNVFIPLQCSLQIKQPTVIYNVNDTVLYYRHTLQAELH